MSIVGVTHSWISVEKPAIVCQAMSIYMIYVMSDDPSCHICMIGVELRSRIVQDPV